MAARSKPPVPVRDADTSRARVWAAAADEFAARGFDGAKVDQIAAAARVNKAARGPVVCPLHPSPAGW
jgi:AcrR family transcriptional regulator